MRCLAFIGFLASAVVCSPISAFGQTPPPLIGFLSSRSPEDSGKLLAAFRRGLSEGGFVEGKNVAIEYRWARGNYEQLPAQAAELVSKPVAVLVSTGGEPAVRAARAATRTIPIVFSMGTDPVKTGFVASYNRPGGNITGVNIFTQTLEGKRLGMLHDLLPKAKTMALLVDPNFPLSASQQRSAAEAARALGVELVVLRGGADQEIDAAFETIARRRIPALSVASGPFFDTRREKLVALAARHRVPAIYNFREYAAAGGLMSYGIDLPDAYRQTGLYAARILKGAKPAELPVVQSSKFELVINLKTAKNLGLAVSRDFLARVDEVIE